MSGNTIDLRGYEQVCSSIHAEHYAAIKGYSMYYFGNSEEPIDVDVTLANKVIRDNPLMTHEEIEEHNQSINMAITCIKQGLSYSEYKVYTAEYNVKQLAMFPSISPLIKVITEESYYELAIDLFMDIQMNVEEDSYIKQLDYSYLDNSQIIHYVFKYHFII